MNINYRFLSPKDSAELFQTNLDAFSDYFVPINITEAQFENHILQNAVDLNFSVGAFFDGKMVAYTLNGFGSWNGKQTAYDAGTGVIPGFRKKGIGKAMFDFLLPKLQEIGIEQMLLEVITQNENAVKLYRKLGFEETRELLYFEQKNSPKLEFSGEIEVREIKKLDWNLLQDFWDGNPSWQFSSESIERKLLPKTYLGAFIKNKIIGYGIVYPNSGVIAQLAVDKNYRRRGAASKILSVMQTKIGENSKLRVANVDFNLTGAISFFRQTGFENTLCQLEMIKRLKISESVRAK